MRPRSLRALAVLQEREDLTGRRRVNGMDIQSCVERVILTFITEKDVKARFKLPT